MKGARQTPMYNPISHLVYVSKGDDVQNTIVNGRVLMRNRKVTSLDETQVLAEPRRDAGARRRARDGRTGQEGSREEVVGSG
jgi:5-methylthioadenosine/S-adenosylhomocysteine deaminase